MAVTLGHVEELIGFDDLDLVFKVTAGLKLPNLKPKVFLCSISHELVGRFQLDLHGYNIGMDITSGHDEELI